VAERFSFSKSTRRCSCDALDGDESVSGESKTLPRVKPEPTFLVTEIIFPVKRRMPRSDLRRAVIGSSFRERKIAIERPIDHAEDGY
jgi:hypothetical protein